LSRTSRRNDSIGDKEERKGGIGLLKPKPGSRERSGPVLRVNEERKLHE